MVRHIVVWNFKDELDAAQKQAAAAKIKAGLEALVGVIPGIVKLEVVTDLLPASTGDAMLDSSFESAAALAGYQSHPEHLKVRAYVHTVVQSRVCMDYEA